MERRHPVKTYFSSGGLEFNSQGPNSGSSQLTVKSNLPSVGKLTYVHISINRKKTHMHTIIYINMFIYIVNK